MDSITLKICIDCLMWIANLDSTGCPEEKLAVVTDPATDPELTHYGIDVDEPSFSWAPCDRCGDTLGGDRVEVERFGIGKP